MADKKSESEQASGPEKPVKATTGAWWKSTVQEEVAIKTEEPTRQADSSTEKGGKMLSSRFLPKRHVKNR